MAGPGWKFQEIGPLRDVCGDTKNWNNPALVAKWSIIRDVRKVVTGALELERSEKTIGSSLQANPTVYMDKNALEAFQGLDAEDIFITSGVNLEEGVGPDNAFRIDEIPSVSVVQGSADGEKNVNAVGKFSRKWEKMVSPYAIGAKGR